MSDLSQTIQQMPLAGLIPAALVVIAGLILWAAGRRVLRSGIAAAGFILGAGLGWFLGHAITIGLQPWIWSVVLAIVFACLAFLLFRLAVAVVLALVVGIAAPMSVVTVSELQGLQWEPPADSSPTEAPADEPESTSVLGDLFPDAAGPIIDESSDWLFTGPYDDNPSDDAEDSPPSTLDIARDADAAIQSARSYTDALLAAVRDWWNRSPEAIRPMMIVAAVVGALAGLLFGTLAPSLTSAIVSAFGGSLLWLGALRVILAQAGQTIESWLPQSASALLIIWIVVSILGVVIQWTFRPKPADKPG